jgi:hypothetical protein
MRIIYRKRWGFSLISYPVEGSTPGSMQGYRAGIFDDSDLWWYSEEIYDKAEQTKSDAYRGWLEILEEFENHQPHFPDGGNPTKEELATEREVAERMIETKEVFKIESAKTGEDEEVLQEEGKGDGSVRKALKGANK